LLRGGRSSQLVSVRRPVELATTGGRSSSVATHRLRECAPCSAKVCHECMEVSRRVCFQCPEVDRVLSDTEAYRCQVCFELPLEADLVRCRQCLPFLCDGRLSKHAARPFASLQIRSRGSDKCRSIQFLCVWKQLGGCCCFQFLCVWGLMAGNVNRCTCAPRIPTRFCIGDECNAGRHPDLENPEFMRKLAWARCGAAGAT